MRSLLLVVIAVGAMRCSGSKSFVVFQTDFGLKDGAVSSMKGVALTVDEGLGLYDLTHEIPPYNVWEAAYRLHQSLNYWPPETVFVSVVDPGVGTQRRSVVAKTKTGHYVVTPDNGTLTLVADRWGLEAVRTIDERTGRLKGSEGSFTFHGRDVYAYTAARLASGTIAFEDVGPLLKDSIIRLPYQPAVVEGNVVRGAVAVLDLPYGNVWTNIPHTMLEKFNLRAGDSVDVSIVQNGRQMFNGLVPYVSTFGAVPPGRAVAYVNSLMNFSLAINQGNFADSFGVRSDNGFAVAVRRHVLISE